MGKIQNTWIQLLLQHEHERSGVRIGDIHLVDKHKSRDMIGFQQLPYRMGVRLNAVHAADQNDSVIEHLQRAFHFGTEVNMAGSIEECEFGLFPGETGLL